MSVPSHLLKGKTAEQKKVIKYFHDSGCLAAITRMKDDEYDEMVLSKMNGLNLKKRALGKIGLDEDQLKEIPPVFLHGYEFDKADSRVGSDDRLRSSKYSATWLFFSDNQVYMYTYVMDMTSDSKQERTEEYFYKDITNFSTSDETVDANRITGCTGNGVKKISREYSRFALVVPGDKFYCSTSGVPNAEQSVRGMKQKLREKKM